MKDYLKKKKASYRLGKYLLNTSDKELVYRIFKELSKYNNKEINKNLKWAKNLKRHITKEEKWMANNTWKDPQHY